MWDLGFADAMAELPDGETVPEGPLAGTLLRRDRTLEIQLAELGHAPGDIDYFAMSHMHFDHAGNANAFRESTWLAREAERDFAFGDVVGLLGWDPTVYEALREVDPILIEGDHDVFGDGSVVIKSAPGHTPGHVVLHIEGGGRRAVMSGDLMHTALQCAEPDLSSCFCVDPALSASTRRAFLERHADTGTLIMPAHFPSPSVGLIKPAGAAFRFAFA